MAKPVTITDAELAAYLDEALAVEAMARIEQALRDDERLRERLAAIHARRDGGLHSLGDIWRRHRVSCPTREELGSYLLDVLDGELRDFVEFHLSVTGCRLCQANLNDLKTRQAEEPLAVDTRRKKYFQSSAGHLPRRK